MQLQAPILGASVAMVALALLIGVVQLPFPRGVYSCYSDPFVIVHVSTNSGSELRKLDVNGKVIAAVRLPQGSHVVGLADDRRIATSMPATEFDMGTLAAKTVENEDVYRFGAFYVAKDQVREVRQHRAFLHRMAVECVYLDGDRLFVGRNDDGKTALEVVQNGQRSRVGMFAFPSPPMGIVVGKEKELAIAVTMVKNREVLSWINLKTGKVASAAQVETDAFPGEETFDRFAMISLFDDGRCLAWCTRSGLLFFRVDWGRSKLGLPIAVPLTAATERW